MKSFAKLRKQTEFYVMLIIILLGLLIQARSGLFFTNNNLLDIARSMIVPSIYAICAFLAFLSTGPDVSFPLIAALSSYLAIHLTTQLGYTGPVIITFLIGIFFGMVMGALNGFIIVRYRFPSLIVTLGTSAVFSGILLGAFEAQRMDLPDSLADFGKRSLLTVVNQKSGLGSTLPLTFLIAVALYLVVYLVLNFTILGRGVYALGGDEISAERAGFPVKRIRFGIFVVNGAVAAIGGLSYSIMSMRYLPTEFAGSEMIIIAAVILGGTRMTGGIGTLKGCILGTLLLTMVANSLILAGVAVIWQKVFVGTIIIIGTAVSAIQGQNRIRIGSRPKSKEAV